MKETKSKLHIQNIFDAVTPQGVDVHGDLLQRCRKLLNRVILQVSNGDFVVVTEDCPLQFIDYVLNMINIKNISIFRIKDNNVNQSNLNAYSIFKSIEEEDKWNLCKVKTPEVNPYMKSNDIYTAAMQAGLIVSDKELKSAKAVEYIRDKAIFSKECINHGISVPSFYTSTKKDLYKKVIVLFEKGFDSLYIRPTKSGGGVGNLTIEHHKQIFSIKNDQNEKRTATASDGFKKIFYENLINSPWDDYIITKCLDLYASPGTLFHVDSKSIRILGHTLQNLNQNHQFQGFQYPIKDQYVIKFFDFIEKSIYALANSWRKRGFTGYANIDWMVTKDGHCFLAEFNPRQTAVFSPFSFICAVLNKRNSDGSFVLPDISIITNDYVYPKRTMSFDEILKVLKKEKLLHGQRTSYEGILITIPPLIDSHITSFGIMAIAEDLQSANIIYSAAINVLTNVDENILAKQINN